MMKTKIIVSVLVVGLIGVAVGYYLFNKKVPGLENVKADFELTADELFDEFDANESTSLAKYEGTVISVTGKVSRVASTDSSASVTIYAENAMAGGVNCSFNKTINGIKKGDNVTIKGRCQGFLMDVVLNNCTK